MLVDWSIFFSHDDDDDDEVFGIFFGGMGDVTGLLVFALCLFRSIRLVKNKMLSKEKSINN